MLRKFLVALKSGHIKVQDRDSPTRDIVTMVPRRAQIKLIKMMLEQADSGQPVRLIIPKARRQGVSAFIQTLNAWLCEYSSNMRAITMAHTQADTHAIFGLAKLAYDHLPGKRSAEVTKDTIKWPHGSSYTCRTAGSKGVARGASFHLMHFSEMAFFQTDGGMDSQAIIAAINSVPFVPGTMIVIESTGSGPSGEFYQRVLSANEGKGPFRTCFMGWWEDDGYRLSAPPDFQPDAELEGLADEFKLGKDQLYFYHVRRQENMGAGDSGFLFTREYPSRLEDCFAAASGRVYPGFSKTHQRELAVDGGWEWYRAIDWGFGPDPLVCLWLLHDSHGDPGLIVNPKCENLIREFQSYQWDSKRDHPKDEHNHGMDALRYGIVTHGLTGLTYVHQELFVHNAASTRPDGVAKLIHQLSGWQIVGGDLTKASPNTEAPIIKGTVADRSQPGLISQFSHWNIPCRGNSKPPKTTTRGEIKDGIAMVQILLGGTTKFYKERVNRHITALDSARDRIMRRHPCRLTEDETAAVEAEIPRPDASRSSYEWMF
jgi:hypothetical protein